MIQPTLISDLKSGDKVLHYGSVFLITEDAKEIPDSSGSTVPVASCKRIEIIDYYSGIEGGLRIYTHFQGIDSVAKLIE